VADRPLLEVGERLGQVEAELAEARERLRKAEDQLARTAIRAPVAGIVLGSTAHTVGGVIAPGATVMELVPSEEPLVAELRVSPTDIDRLQVGAAVRAQLLAFPQRHLPAVAGAVAAVSADVLQDADGRPHYLVRARLDPASLAAAATHLAGPLALTPGMPVQAVIEAGRATLLGYLVEPLRLSLGRAFKDG
jgi:HlyD family type I secretion membrane fusion protein